METAPQPLRLLVVEDHADTSRSLAQTLSRHGFLVTVVMDGESGLALTAAQPFDLLLSDLQLPKMSGYALMELVAERHGIPGIAVSGSGMKDDVARAREAGFSEHLIKPVTITRLIEAIERAAKRGG